jgi:hypothetical protein
MINWPVCPWYDFVFAHAPFAKHKQGTGIEPVGAPLFLKSSQQFLQCCFIAAPEQATHEDILDSLIVAGI